MQFRKRFGSWNRAASECGVVSREEEAEEEEESGEYEFHPNASIALCPSFSPSFSRFSHHPPPAALPPSSPSPLLLPPPLFPGSRSTSTRPSSIRPSLPLQSSPRLPSSRGFIGSLIAASVSLDRLTTYVDAIFKILRNTCPCVVRRDDDQGDELLLGLMVLEIGFVRDVRGGGLILFFFFLSFSCWKV